MVTRGERVRVDERDAGDFWRVTIASGKGNVLDLQMIDDLRRLFEDAATAPHLRVVCLEGAGSHFSFGASVEEHLPGVVDTMLPRLHAAFRAMLDSSVFLMAAVRGHCLGGGLELVAACHRVLAAPDAKLGQPEIRLGVFAPIGSLVLPPRVGFANAAELCLTGRVVGAETALGMGLVDEIAADPAAAALAWAEEHVLQHSAASLRHAVRALRRGTHPGLAERLDELERDYLESLMATGDAREGLHAFVEKRPPVWSNA